jgi:hypothetical protein
VAGPHRHFGAPLVGAARLLAVRAAVHGGALRA